MRRIGVCTLNGSSGHEAGRELLRQLYYAETGRELPEIVIGQWGKPCFPEGKYHFSITHTRQHAFCILSDRPVGIDAEELGRPIRDVLVERALSPSEKEQYLAAEDRSRAFLTFWVLKEALVKLTGRGLQGFPNWTAFCLTDPRVFEMEGCLVAVMTEGEEENAV